MLDTHGGGPPSGSKPPSKRAEQTVPQPPQLFGSFEKFTHDVGLVLFGQPFGNEPPSLQEPPQEPMHVAVPLAGAVHTVPQAPQLFRSVEKSTQDVGLIAFGQGFGNEVLLLHEPTQVAPLHAVDPLVGAVGHIAHVLAQSIVLAGQLLQPPPLQPAGHIVPHMPQLFGSVMVFTHEVGLVLLGQGVGKEPLVHAATHVVPLHDVPPLVGAAGHIAHVPPQLIMPEAHWQTPLAQLPPVGHTVPQPPQLLLSVCSFTQAPLQRLVGALQLVTHPPPLQVTDPPAGAAPHA
jgi:hypothetical protein